MQSIEQINQTIQEIKNSFFPTGFYEFDWSIANEFVIAKTKPFSVTVPSSIKLKSKEDLKESLKILFIQIILLKFDNRIKEATGDYYEPNTHSELFECLYQAFYKSKPTNPQVFRIFKPYIPGMLVWDKNSCYSDSLLSVLYYSTTSIIHEIVNNSSSLAMKMKSEYNKIASQKNIVSNIRKDFVSDYDFHDVASLYDKISDVLGLGMTISSLCLSQNIDSFYGPIKPTTRTYSTIPMWDFIDPNPRVSGVGNYFLWDEITKNNPYLVFHNTRIPKIKDYDDPKDEIIENTTIKKDGVFGERILNGNYELDAVVLHKGSDESGHYVSFIKSKFVGENAWFMVDDLDNKFVYVGKSPRPELFKETDYTRPELLFYSRVQNPKPITQRSFNFSINNTRFPVYVRFEGDYVNVVMMTNKTLPMDVKPVGIIDDDYGKQIGQRFRMHNSNYIDFLKSNAKCFMK